MQLLSLFLFYQTGCTALIVAADKGHHECLQLFLKHGAEIDKANLVSAVKVCPYW